MLQGLARFRRQDNARQDPQEAPARLRRAYSKRQTSAKKAVNETTRQPIIQNQALPTLRQIHPQRPCILFIKCSGLRRHCEAKASGHGSIEGTVRHDGGSCELSLLRINNPARQSQMPVKVSIFENARQEHDKVARKTPRKSTLVR